LAITHFIGFRTEVVSGFIHDFHAIWSQSIPVRQNQGFLMPVQTSRVIVITGATRGCGRAIVDRFVEAGHTVVGCGRSES
jgi:hypothetical protein